MFWIAIAYLMITYVIGGLLFAIKHFRTGYSNFGVACCILASPFWVFGLVFIIIGMILVLPILCFHDNPNKKPLPEFVPDAPDAWLGQTQKKFKPKFGLNNKCEVKDL